jgi:hypothetical protein
VKAWLAKHPRFHLHFILTSASWFNLVERFVSGIMKCIRQRSRSLAGDLRYPDEHSTDPKTFVWSRTAYIDFK